MLAEKHRQRQTSRHSILSPFRREQPRPVSVYCGCAGVVGKGALRRVWLRSGQEAGEVSARQRFDSSTGTPAEPQHVPPPHTQTKDRIKPWFDI